MWSEASGNEKANPLPTAHANKASGRTSNNTYLGLIGKG